MTLYTTNPTDFGTTVIEWNLVTNTARAESPWSLEDVVQVFDGEKWAGTASIMPVTRIEARAFSAWLAQVQGRRHVFFFGDPDRAVPLGGAALDPGSPVIDGGGQTGREVLLKNADPNITDWLLAGDHIQLGNGIQSRLHMVLENCSTDGSGGVTVKIWPKLRGETVGGTIVKVLNPVGVFALARPVNGWSTRAPSIDEPFPLQVREVVDQTV